MLFDIQSDQNDRVSEIIAAAGAESFRMCPWSHMRISHLRGQRRPIGAGDTDRPG
ncbi:MAG: hypothetical protein U5K31_12715 [Balneolaceae bacterium]|nr:hypothetical protein [Balneolaceae bacterium]